MPPESGVNSAAVGYHWGLEDGASWRELAHGANNRTWRVETASGVFAVRQYLNTADPARLSFEHDLLTQLAAAGLWFAVPAPIATRDGRTWVVDGEGQAFSAARWIEGESPDTGDWNHVRELGLGLAHLGKAMAGIPVPAAACARPHSVLEHVHALVPDPRDLTLGLPPGDAVRLRELHERVSAEAPDAYARLPQQLIHNDFVPSNTLFVGNRLRGVLDFEFATFDLRVLEFASAILQVCLLPAQHRTAEPWPWVETFSAGYAASLLDDEIAAIPSMLLLRQLVVTMHWTGRWLAGLSSQERARDCAQRLLALDGWLEAEGSRLIHCVANALQHGR
ncbi:MAG: phosphotransferase [Chloroflexi bacterium]|nr:phosphotransferase [Chloroflexota bacterium]